MVRIERKRNVGNAAVVTGTTATKKKARATATGSSSFAHSLAGVASSEQNIGDIDQPRADNFAAHDEIGDISLLAIQEYSSSNEKKSHKKTHRKAHKKAIELGEGLLERLEGLHIRILSENIPSDELEQMEKFFAQKREYIQDEKLRDILAEIDLRVQVELAKRRK